MSEPVNKLEWQWLDEIIQQHRVDVEQLPPAEAFINCKLAITSKINEIEQEAYRSGYVAGGVEILNASCEICHAYPMTADCNNANCHAIEI